jgi:hypothetical protein
MDKDTLHKEIDLIQSVITRMANNSFLLKGWLISLIVVVIALTKDTIVASELTYFNIILTFPVIIFWYLDAFFLHKEKCYIKLFEWVIENRSISTEYMYSLDYKRFQNKVKSIYKIMFSKTLFLFYGFIIAILVILSLHNIVI